MTQYVMAKQSILDARMQCPECESVVSVGLCEPDIDGEGSLGCPCCLTNENKRVAMKECKPDTFRWEDPECDPVAAIRQIQEVLDKIREKLNTHEISTSQIRGGL